MKRIYKLLLIIVLLTTVYTIIRYHVFGPVLWKDIFVYTLNKIIIFNAVFFILFVNAFKINENVKILFIKTILVFVVLHILFSVFILKPYYLKSFFDTEGSLNLTANLSLLAGSLAAIIMILKKQININPVLSTKIFLFLVLTHLFFMGIKSWLHPETWYGGLFPITLIAFVILMITFLKYLFRKNS